MMDCTVFNTVVSRGSLITDGRGEFGAGESSGLLHHNGDRPHVDAKDLTFHVFSGLLRIALGAGLKFLNPQLPSS